MSLRCAECLKNRERCRNAVRDANGNVSWVCPSCWRQHGYDDGMHPLGCPCPHCGRFPTRVAR